MGKIVVWMCLAVALALSGCASIDPKVLQSKTSGKSVAVASAVGDEIALQWIGTTVFNNEKTMLPVPDWKLDATLADRAAESLRKTNRYTEVFTLPGVTRQSPDFPKVESAKKADFVILIEPVSMPDQSFQTNQTMRGIGIMQRTMFNSLRRTVGYAALRVELFDAHTGESLGAAQHARPWYTGIVLQPGPKFTGTDQEEFKQSVDNSAPATVVTILENMGLKER